MIYGDPVWGVAINPVDKHPEQPDRRRATRTRRIGYPNMVEMAE